MFKSIVKEGRGKRKEKKICNFTSILYIIYILYICIYYLLQNVVYILEQFVYSMFHSIGLLRSQTNRSCCLFGICKIDKEKRSDLRVLKDLNGQNQHSLSLLYRLCHS